ARGFACTSACDPSSYNGLRFTTEVAVADFAAALSVRDVTTGREQPVAPASAVRRSDLDQSMSPNIEDAGFDRQPAARTYASRLDPNLRSADGQTLGYPWVGIVENWHERAFTSFGDGHGV